MPDRERLIQLIYDGVLDDAAWTAAPAMVADTVRSAGAGPGVQDTTTHEFSAVAQSGAEVSVGTGSSLDLGSPMSVDDTLDLCRHGQLRCCDGGHLQQRHIHRHGGGGRRQQQRDFQPRQGQQLRHSGGETISAAGDTGASKGKILMLMW